tara:strand:- start:1054 stop:1746 length:693 start_codon:yes stop_codon:yes gene_type:complete
MDNILAIIPARGGSKRVPRKNLKKILGVPLVAHAVLQAKESKYINQIIVSTDDSEIESVASDYGAQVISRPEEFRHDNTLMEADNILVDVVKRQEILGEIIDIIVLLYPTAPLRRVSDIDKTIEKVLNEGNDSSLSLVSDQGYYWRREKESGELTPSNYNPNQRMPSVMHSYEQFKENKAVYVCTRDLLINTSCRLGGEIGYVTMSSLDSVDIDTEEDLKLCEELMKLRK